MAKPYYPQIDEKALAAFLTIKQQMGQHEGYLESPDCPYDEFTRIQLVRLTNREVVEKVVETVIEKVVERKAETAVRAAEGGGTGPKKVTLKTSGVDQQAVSAEIQGLRTELAQLKMDSKGLQTSDKLAIIKVRAGLVEKLVQMDERINNLKRLSLFQSTVMGVLDDVVDEGGRKEFLKRIEPFAREEG